jgi:membrane-bound lytic murein transglycosylase F
MRGDPPLIGARRAQAADYRRSLAPQQAVALARYNPPHRHAPRLHSAFRRRPVRVLTLRRLPPFVARLALGAALLAAGCEGPPRLPPPDKAGELVVMVRPGPGTYFPGPDGEPTGLDTELARLFAAEQKLPVRFVMPEDATHLIDEVAQGRAHVGAGGLFRPPPVIADTPAVPVGREPPSRRATEVLWTRGYHAVEPVLIYNAEGFKPTSWRDLDDEDVVYVASTVLDTEIEAIRTAHPGVRFDARSLPSTAALIGDVSDGRISYAIVASNIAAIARNSYLGFEVAFPVGGQRQLAWAVAPHLPALRDDIDRFFATLARRGTLQRLIDRYFTQRRQVPRIDAVALQERIRSLLPEYRRLFQAAQETTGLEWRLLAAIAYQESQWDPLATSETGVRGIMQISADTARHLGGIDRLDPRASIDAAAQYIRDLRDKLPARIREPDRTWLALAAFNIGVGHLEDARVLAQKQKLDPDSWTDVKKVLPLLAVPEFYEQAKNGFARGGMPVAFVDRVRAYYDVLLAHQPAYVPRLRAYVSVSDPDPPAGAAATAAPVVRK